MIDLDAEMGFWCDVLSLPSAGWKVTWAWADAIPHNGGSALGLNTTNVDERTSHIQIKKPVTEFEMSEFVDTCAHEAAHCFGAEIERRLLEAQSLDERVNAHEYIAETLAPALTRIKNTPREMAFAKAIKSLSGKTEAFAKVAQSMPARAKGTRMEKEAILAMLAMVNAASSPEEKEKLLAELQNQLQQSTDGPKSVPAVDPLAAAGPPVPEKPVDGATPAAKPLEDGYMKVVDVLLDSRSDFDKPRRAEVRGYIQKHHKTVEGAAEYLKTIPLAKTTQEPKAPAAKPLDVNAPRPGAQDGQMRLGKTDKDSVLTVAKAMGQSTEPVRGPTILANPDGTKKFTLGNMTPTAYRAKRATGWDPRKTFPLGSEVAQ